MLPPKFSLFLYYLAVECHLSTLSRFVEIVLSLSLSLFFMRFFIIAGRVLLAGDAGYKFVGPIDKSEELLGPLTIDELLGPLTSRKCP